MRRILIIEMQFVKYAFLFEKAWETVLDVDLLVKDEVKSRMKILPSIHTYTSIIR